MVDVGAVFYVGAFVGIVLLSPVWPLFLAVGTLQMLLLLCIAAGADVAIAVAVVMALAMQEHLSKDSITIVDSLTIKCMQLAQNPHENNDRCYCCCHDCSNIM